MQKLKQFLVAGTISTVLTLGAVESYKPLLRSNSQTLTTEILDYSVQYKFPPYQTLSYLNSNHDSLNKKIPNDYGFLGFTVISSLIISAITYTYQNRYIIKEWEKTHGPYKPKDIDKNITSAYSNFKLFINSRLNKYKVNSEQNLINNNQTGTRPCVDPLILLKKAKSMRYDYRKFAASALNADVETLITLASDKVAVVRAEVALNPRTPLYILKKLSTDVDINVRLIVAGNPNATEDIIKILIKDCEFIVKLKAVENKNFSKSLIGLLLYQDSRIIKAALKNVEALPSDILFRIIKKSDENIEEFNLSNMEVIFNGGHSDESVEQIILSNIDRICSDMATKKIILSTFASNSDRFIRLLVAINIDTPTHIIKKLLYDKDKLIRAAVALNPRTNRYMLDVLADDDEYLIRYIVEKNPITDDVIQLRLLKERLQAMKNYQKKEKETWRSNVICQYHEDLQKKQEEKHKQDELKKQADAKEREYERAKQREAEEKERKIKEDQLKRESERYRTESQHTREMHEKAIHENQKNETHKKVVHEEERGKNNTDTVDYSDELRKEREKERKEQEEWQAMLQAKSDAIFRDTDGNISRPMVECNIYGYCKAHDTYH